MENLNLFYTTCGSLIEAKKLSTKIVDDGFASCINIIENVHSYYKENSNTKFSSETILIIKTVKGFGEIEDYLNNNHPYDTPIIVELNIKEINSKYMNWVFKNL